LLLSFYAIAIGAGVVIAAMLATGTLKTGMAVLVPVGSMIIATAMIACGQSIERFRADVTEHVGNTEGALALGAVSADAPQFSGSARSARVAAREWWQLGEPFSNLAGANEQLVGRPDLVDRAPFLSRLCAEFPASKDKVTATHAADHPRARLN
jgi:hypothetical protein